MPRGDRTGPVGYGPMTGRGAGFVQVLRYRIFSPMGRGFREEAAGLDIMAVEEVLGINSIRQVCLFGQEMLILLSPLLIITKIIAKKVKSRPFPRRQSF